MRGRRLGRTSAHRTAMGRNLISSLFLHGRIETTAPKAKEYRGRAEKLITLAKTRNLASIRRATAALQDKAAVSKLFAEIGPAFAARPGGYTRIVKLSRRRLGDQGALVYLELLNFVPKPKEPKQGDAKAAAVKSAKATIAKGAKKGAPASEQDDG
ncbi:MAG: 50S ribosomal protein L17 [Planctomycetota bacterium]